MISAPPDIFRVGINLPQVMDSPHGLIAFAVFASLSGLWLAKRFSVAKNIPGPPSASFFTGNLLQLVAPETGRDWQLNANKVHEGVARIRTLFGGSALLVNDPKALHHILVKDQDIFEEWPAFTATNALLFGDGLVATIGDQHKKQRKMLTPAFSIKHLRGMTPLFVSIARELEQHISSMVRTQPIEIDVTPWLNRFALEVIGKGGLGHSFGKLSQHNDFSAAAKDLAASVSVLVPGAPLTPWFKYLGPAQFRRFILKLIPWGLLQRLVDIVNIMDAEVHKIFAAQQKALDAGVSDEGEGKDIMGILPTDTTSGAIARLLHLLALNPDVQSHLRHEVVQAFHHQDEAIDFSNVSALPYLDAVVRETLRVYPPIPTIFRQALKDTVVPLLHPITGVDGEIMKEVYIEKGTDIFINILGSNHHPKTWGGDADEWKPERWLTDLPDSVLRNRELSGVYSHQMTFLAGKRACIGFNFSQLEMKVALAILIQSLEFSLPKDKEVGWNVGLLMTPVIRGSNSIHGQLPLVIKKLD
ncbi:hypothetical protein CVT26_002631 [Gymnopilus dilepis]|uniref:Cytochrome P450 n=1 Tax=Gymnopilus dilepis TaxID=231916 RepID=A0A409VDC0_9AGAR|nr:hypothetical protein CVT26_002631 [Gymnopilus dilepis]